MDITPMMPGDSQIIDAYGPGHFRVSGEVYDGPIIVFPDEVRLWPISDFLGITIDSFGDMPAKQVEVLLVGTGAKMQLLPSPLKKSLRAVGVGVEVMDTGAACRTYNVLMAEGRHVAAALMLVRQT